MKTRWLFLTLLLIELVDSQYLNEGRCIPRTCNPTKPGLLNVHVISHTHLDAGWLQTFDGYYTSSVKDIFDAMVKSLTQKADRRHIVVEMGFFSRWWGTQTDLVKQKVCDFVSSGQLEFVGGGWVMTDEATPYYLDTVDQMSLGLTWLRDNFGECSLPTTGWQIDPFGHSKEMASIFAQMGFNGFFFTRIDHQDLRVRQLTKSMEFIWKSNPSLGAQSNIFTGNLPHGYCDGYFELIQGSLNVKDIITKLKTDSTRFRTNNIMLPVGCDFSFPGKSFFNEIDNLIKSVNALEAKEGVHVLYSTPSCYLRSLQEANVSWPIKRDDFFPYSSARNVYWTGYYTTRPSQKLLIKYGHNVLQAAKQLHVFADLGQNDRAKIRELKKAMGILQHHDAITGTSQVYVAADYVRMLSTGILGAQEVISNALQKIYSKDSAFGPSASSFMFCNQKGISVCELTESLNGDSRVLIIVYNPVSHIVRHYFRLPVNGSVYRITDVSGNAVYYQLVPNLKTINTLPGRGSHSSHEIAFKANLPAFGFLSFVLEKVNATEMHEMEKTALVTDSRLLVNNTKRYTREISRNVSEEQNVNENEKAEVDNESMDELIIRGSKVEAAVDSRSGLLKWVSLKNGLKVNVTQNFYLYKGIDSGAGAYTFIVGSDKPEQLSRFAAVEIIRGPLVEEIHQIFNEQVSQVIRIYREEDYVEFDWVVGPVLVDNGIGADIVTKFNTDLVTRGVFYTDANGRQTMRRKRNRGEDFIPRAEETVSSNYYPVTSWIYIRDEKRDIQMTLFPDRPQGGSSIFDGSLELSVHRRYFTNDNAYGLSAALDERGSDGKGLKVRGKHRLVINSIGKSFRLIKRKSKKFALQPVLAFKSIGTNVLPTNGLFLGMTAELPRNIHIITLESLDDSKLLLRLEHVFEADIDPLYSTPVDIDLGNAFSKIQVTGAYETTLSGVQGKQRSDAERLAWLQDDGEKTTSINPINKRYRVNYTGNSLYVTLYPMEIVTLILDYVKK